MPGLGVGFRKTILKRSLLCRKKGKSFPSSQHSGTVSVSGLYQRPPTPASHAADVEDHVWLNLEAKWDLKIGG
jgi:hypothetical protein